MLGLYLELYSTIRVCEGRSNTKQKSFGVWLISCGVDGGLGLPIASMPTTRKRWDGQHLVREGV